MMERKANRPGVSRLNSDPSKPFGIPVEGKAGNLLTFKNLQLLKQKTK